MPKGQITLGSSWGRLRCVDITRESRSVGTGDYDGFQERQSIQYLLHCGCGNEFTVWASDFSGKRYVKDCGCGIAQNDGLGVDIKIRVTMDVMNIMREYRGSRGMSLGLTASELIRKGWEAYLSEQVRK